MKEGSEGDALPLSLSKKDAGNNATNQTSSPTLVPPTLASTPPYLTAPLSAATLAAIGVEVAAAAAAAAAHAAAGVETPKADNNGGGKLARVPKDSASPGSRDKIFVCSVCNRCFGYKHVLQNHERTHTGEKPFECKECHKRFTRDHHLKTHMRLHTGEKPYHCTHCERQFVQVANLRRHLRVHTGERPYACELCTSRFSDSNQLKAHMLIHKGEKPFECKQCLGRFRRRHHLMHHKCPKDDGNLGKPRRGRRPKTAEDLERDARQLPTVVPERPKRERKPRETRRIIKVSIPPIMALGEGSRYTVATSFAARPPPPISPPEQTEPEDLSMHSSDNGERQTSRSHQQQPPRPSSVPLSIGTGVHVPGQLRPSRAETPPGGGRARMLQLVTADNDGEDSESEAMVEEEEEDEDEDDEDVDGGSGGHGFQHRRRIRMRGGGAVGEQENEDELHEDVVEDEEEDLLSEGMMEGDDEDSEMEDAEDCRDRRVGRMQHESGSEAENGGTVSPCSVMSNSRQQPTHHPHHPLHHHSHHHPHLHPHPLPHHPTAQGIAVSHPLGLVGAVAGRSGPLQMSHHNTKSLNMDEENGDGGRS